MTAADIAAWTSAAISGVALFASGAAGWAAVRSLQWEKDSAESARRSADAAEHSNRLAQRALERAGEPQPTVRPPDVNNPAANLVDLHLEPRGGNRWVLRNRGTETAEHVSVERPAGINRQFPTDATIRPNEGVDILMMGAWGSPIPNQLYATWEGQDEPFALAVPPQQS